MHSIIIQVKKLYWSVPARKIGRENMLIYCISRVRYRIQQTYEATRFSTVACNRQKCWVQTVSCKRKNSSKITDFCTFRRSGTGIQKKLTAARFKSLNTKVLLLEMKTPPSPKPNVFNSVNTYRGVQNTYRIACRKMITNDCARFCNQRSAGIWRCCDWAMHERFGSTSNPVRDLNETSVVDSRGSHSWSQCLHVKWRWTLKPLQLPVT
jgi:hypothetical protein